MPLSPTFWMIVAAALLVYLCCSVALRLRADRLRQNRFPGTAFDASTIAPRVHQVRQDYLASLRSQPHQASRRRGLVAAARQVVTSFSYFRRARCKEEVHEHDVL